MSALVFIANFTATFITATTTTKAILWSDTYQSPSLYQLFKYFKTPIQSIRSRAVHPISALY